MMLKQPTTVLFSIFRVHILDKHNGTSSQLVNIFRFPAEIWLARRLPWQIF